MYPSFFLDQVLETSSEDRARENGYKLKKNLLRANIGRYGFTKRVVNDWNRLDRRVVSDESISSFERRMDRVLPY